MIGTPASLSFVGDWEEPHLAADSGASLLDVRDGGIPTVKHQTSRKSHTHSNVFIHSLEKSSCIFNRRPRTTQALYLAFAQDVTVLAKLSCDFYPAGLAMKSWCHLDFFVFVLF